VQATVKHEDASGALTVAIDSSGEEQLLTAAEAQQAKPVFQVDTKHKYKNDGLRRDCGANPAFLDPNHTHYLLIDDGKELEKDGNCAWGGEIAVRNALENQIIFAKDAKAGSTAQARDGETLLQQIPSLVLVHGGGVNTVVIATNAVKRNIPVVIVANSGRAADLMQAKKEKRQEDFQRILGLVVDETFPNYRAKREEIAKQIEDLVEQAGKQLYVWDLANPDDDLVQIIIRSLVENERLERNVKLAMLTRWTSSDTPGAADAVQDLLQGIAEEESSPMQVHDPHDCQGELLVHAAYHDQGKLFRYLLNHGYSPALLDALIRHELTVTEASTVPSLKTVATAVMAANKISRIEREAATPSPPAPAEDGTIRKCLRRAESQDSGPKQSPVFRKRKSSSASLLSWISPSPSPGLRRRTSSTALLSPAPLLNEWMGALGLALDSSDCDSHQEGSLTWDKIYANARRHGCKECEGEVPSHIQNLEFNEHSWHANEEFFNELEEGRIRNFCEKELTFFDRLYWACVTERADLCQVMCDNSDHPMVAGLLVSQISRRLAEKTHMHSKAFTDQAEKYDRYATEVLERISTHQMAIEVLTSELYAGDDTSVDETDKRTMTLRSLSHYFEDGHRNRIDFAIEAGNKTFLASSHVQTYITRLWTTELEKRANLHFSSYVCFVFLYLLTIFLRPRPGASPYNCCPSNSTTCDSDAERGGVCGGMWHAWPWDMLDGICGADGRQCWAMLNLILHVYILSYVYDEYKQMDSTFWHYLRGTNNMNDCVVIGLFLFGSCCSVTNWFIRGGFSWEALFDQDLEGAYLIVPNDIASLNFVACVVRILEMYSVHHRDLGTLYITTKKICVKDVWVFTQFSVIMMLMFIPLSFVFLPHLSPAELVVEVILWPTLGEVEVAKDTHLNHPRTTPFATAFFCAYFIFMTIVMINLLIAMMSNTYESVQQQADIEWKYLRVLMVKEYDSISTDPPPFNLTNVFMREPKFHPNWGKSMDLKSAEACGGSGGSGRGRDDAKLRQRRWGTFMVKQAQKMALKSGDKSGEYDDAGGGGDSTAAMLKQLGVQLTKISVEQTKQRQQMEVLTQTVKGLHEKSAQEQTEQRREMEELKTTVQDLHELMLLSNTPA
jgi:hypothetical protein